MKKLIVAVAAMLAATLLSGNAYAVTGSAAKALHASGSVVKVSCHHAHGCYHRGCGGCGRLYTYTTRYTTCGTCGGGACWGGCGGCGYYSSAYYGPNCGCGCGSCGCGGYYGGGWSLFGWLF
ncbi:MAG: hypothetical protein ACLPJW_20305 [Rhodomicrobium sp.]